MIINKKRNKISEYNIKKVFPNISSKRLKKILFCSQKLHFINIIMCCHQIFLIDRNIFIYKFNKLTNIPKYVRKYLEIYPFFIKII